MSEQTSATDQKSIWVFIEHTDGRIADVSLELTGKARELADPLGYEVVGLLCGHDVEELARDVIRHGADRVLLAEFAVDVPRAGPDAAHAQADRGAPVQLEVLPHPVDVLFLEAHHGNPGGAGDFDKRDVVFFSYVGESSQQLRIEQSAGNVGGDRIGRVVALRDGSFFA